MIRKAIAPDRKKRYRNLEEMARALEEIQARPQGGVIVFYFLIVKIYDGTRQIECEQRFENAPQIVENPETVALLKEKGVRLPK